MNLVLFILVLGVLVFIHELGHFLFAKLFKVRVDEFGFGYPPLAKKIFSWKGTDFTLNWIPFGGFVKIFSKNTIDRDLTELEKYQCIESKPRGQQLLIMLGGIIFNIIFAALLFISLFSQGYNFSNATLPDKYETEVQYLVNGAEKDSPAFNAGLGAGQEILSISNSKNVSIDLNANDHHGIVTFIGDSLMEELDLTFVTRKLSENPVETIIPFEGKDKIGIALDRVSKIDMPFYASVYYGARESIFSFSQIGKGFIQLVTGKISGDALSGPVGIAGQVGQAADYGFQYLVAFTALLSINLAVLNLVPFPALDGGRILIILIESIIRRELNPKITGWINVVGFFILIALMLFVTVKDLIKIF